MEIRNSFNLIYIIKSTKTTSMEDVSTGLLEKIKNIWEVKIKPKNDMMYQDIYNSICQNTKNEGILSSMSNPQPNWCLKIEFQQVDRNIDFKFRIHVDLKCQHNMVLWNLPVIKIDVSDDITHINKLGAIGTWFYLEPLTKVPRNKYNGKQKHQMHPIHIHT